MLEKLIEYLKHLPKEEQKKLMEALQAEESTRQEESTTEQTEEAKQGESATTEQTSTEGATTEQEVENVEEQREETDNAQVEEADQQEQQNNTTTEKQSEELATDNPPAFQELLETKIELALIKLGIREDRIEAAKRLFKTEIHSIEDLDKLKELVKEFPEWQKQKREQGAGFGANLKENGNSLSEEEKKLKSMGIDPKN